MVDTCSSAWSLTRVHETSRWRHPGVTFSKNISVLIDTESGMTTSNNMRCYISTLGGSFDQPGYQAAVKLVDDADKILKLGEQADALGREKTSEEGGEARRYRARGQCVLVNNLHENFLPKILEQSSIIEVPRTPPAYAFWSSKKYPPIILLILYAINQCDGPLQYLVSMYLVNTS